MSLRKFPSKQSSWWRRLGDALKASFIFVFKRRLQDVLIKKKIFALLIRLKKTSSRCLQDVLIKTNTFIFIIRLQDVFKTSSRHLQIVFKTSSSHLQDILLSRFQDVFKTLQDVLQNVFKTPSRRLAKMSSRLLQDVSSSQTVLVHMLLHLLVAAYRGIFRPWSNVTMEFFLRKYLKVLSIQLFSQESSIVDVRLGWK